MSARDASSVSRLNPPSAIPDSAPSTSMISGMGRRCGTNLSKALRLSRSILNQAAIQAGRSAEGLELAATLAVAFSTLQSQAIASLNSMDSSDSEADSPRARGKASTFSSPTSSSSLPQAASIDLTLAQFQPRDFAAPSSSGTSTCQVLVCQGRKCQANGALGVLQAASAVVGASSVDVMPCKCLGKCKLGVAMKVVASDEVQLYNEMEAPSRAPKGHVYTGVEASTVGRILDAHFL